MERIEKIRGTEDIFDQYAAEFEIIRNKFSSLAKQYGYSYIQTPVIENRNLFIRSIGNTSDIVKKEFYEFKDKGERDIVLRPEGTASVIRAIVESKMLNTKPLPLKYFYFAPMFRYERPQSGRLRQFHQFGVECVGTNSYYDDVETISLAMDLVNELNMKDCYLSINNIGSPVSRKQWIDVLTKYFEKYQDQLTNDSRSRIHTNPLRILDDKVDGNKDFVINAPKIDQFLSQEEKDYFTNVCQQLDNLKIKYKVDNNLVRGLDYYSNLVFEVNTIDPVLKGQPTILGGGRYGSLVAELGGSDVSCVGFAIGIERLLVLMNAQKLSAEYKLYVDVCLAPINNSFNDYSLLLANNLRKNGLRVITNYSANKMKANFKLSEQYFTKYILIYGQKEVDNHSVIVKDQEKMTETEVQLKDLLNFLQTNENH
ncbi:MAG: histidine--tRNA ligase [Mycoplasma sp.]